MQDKTPPSSRPPKTLTGRSGEYRLNLKEVADANSKEVEKARQEVARHRSPSPPPEALLSEPPLPSDPKVVHLDCMTPQAAEDARAAQEDATQASSTLLAAVDELVSPMYFLLASIQSVVRYGRIHIALLCILLAVLVYAVRQQDRVTAKLQEQQARNETLARELQARTVAVLNQQMQGAVLEAVQGARKDGKVELVAESDPEKRRHTPIKVRVSTSADSDGVDVEIPISAAAVRQVDLARQPPVQPPTE